MTNVIKFQAPFERLKEQSELPGEVALRRAIILQAIIDATNVGKNTNAQKLEKEAKEWIFEDNQNFRQICLEASMEPNHVRQIARDIIAIHHNNFKKISQHKNNMIQFSNFQDLVDA